MSKKMFLVLVSASVLCSPGVAPARPQQTASEPVFRPALLEQPFPQVVLPTY